MRTTTASPRSAGSRACSRRRRRRSTPLLFDPGDEWEYGSNIDWVGQVVEGITGRRLGEVMAERIFAPLDMNSSGFKLTADMRSRLARMHQREADGSLKAMPDFELPQDPEVHMGGHALYSTVGDYQIHPHVAERRCRCARPRPEERDRAGGGEEQPRAHEDQGLPGVIPTLSNYAEFFPGMPKSWALTFMINDEDAPTGRPAGALAWAGLPNLYYWIDRKNGIGGFWATQVFPFADPTSVGGYLEFETAVYDGLSRQKAA